MFRRWFRYVFCLSALWLVVAVLVSHVWLLLVPRSFVRSVFGDTGGVYALIVFDVIVIGLLRPRLERWWAYCRRIHPRPYSYPIEPERLDRP